MTDESVTREDRLEKYTGKVIVVLKRDLHMTKVVDEIGDNLLVRAAKVLCPCAYD
jgi:hypothetical protein